MNQLDCNRKIDSHNKWVYEKITQQNNVDIENISKNEQKLLAEIKRLNEEINEMTKLYLTSKEGEACFR